MMFNFKPMEPCPLCNGYPANWRSKTQCECMTGRPLNRLRAIADTARATMPDMSDRRQWRHEFFNRIFALLPYCPSRLAHVLYLSPQRSARATSDNDIGQSIEYFATMHGAPAGMVFASSRNLTIGRIGQGDTCIEDPMLRRLMWEPVK